VTGRQDGDCPGNQTTTMKTFAILIAAALLAACASGPQQPKTAAELQCDYEARRAMSGNFGANAFEALELYRVCVAAKRAGGVL